MNSSFQAGRRAAEGNVAAASASAGHDAGGHAERRAIEPREAAPARGRRAAVARTSWYSPCSGVAPGSCAFAA
jgi:hypothetical protein